VKIETSALSIDRFVARITRHAAPAENRSWSNPARAAIWICLGIAAWGVLILLGYFIWAEL